MKFFYPLIFCVTLVFLSLAGCSTLTPYQLDPKDETLSFVFGYISPGYVNKVFLKKFDVTPAPGYGCGNEREPGENGGLFYHWGIVPGSYQIDAFWTGSQGAFPGATFDLGDHAPNQTAIHITKPGLYFMGSYSYDAKWKLIGKDTFDIKKVKSPSEKTLVARLMKMMESEGDDKAYVRQYGWLKKRYAELGN